ncbi:hypothetical protein DFH11DRAFT_1510840 [Phellopilus nigrolimitatus]|nr:hypothetical protein DFH11DRAFT_1510840 [Phellopilus nigrolimitatus]
MTSSYRPPHSLFPHQRYLLFLAPCPLQAPKPTLAARRSANVRAINPTIDITPTQSRAGSPVSPNEDEVKATRATVLAYYQIPPPSPPPTGPLPPPPPDSEDPKSPDDRQFLSPTRPFGNGRSLSPLRNLSPGSPQGAYSPTRSPSPGLFAQPIPSVRRGRESPFPARPILPPEDGRSLITRVARYKTLHVDQHADGEDAQRSSDEVFDTHTSAYIRDARARGEKRVYFTESTMVEKDSLANALLEAEDGAEEDDRSFYADEFDADNRRSVTDMSMYSRFSVLDADRSAQLRNGFVRRVEELYEADKARQGQENWDDIPDVPELPAALRDAAPGKGILKGSSPYKF